MALVKREAVRSMLKFEHSGGASFMERKQKQLFVVVGASVVVIAVVLFMMMRSDSEAPSPELARTVSEQSEEHDPVVSRGKAGPATGARRLEGVPDEVTTTADELGLTEKQKKKRKKSKRRAKPEEPASEEDASGFQPVGRIGLKKPEKGP